MEIKIGEPDEDGLQKYRVFFEKIENTKDKIIIIKYNEWLQTKSGRIFDLKNYEHVIQNVPTVYYNRGDIKEKEVLNESGFLIVPAVYYDGTEVKKEGRNYYDEFYNSLNTDGSIELINEIVKNV